MRQVIMSILKPIRLAAVRISFVFVLVLLLVIEMSCSANRLRKANVDEVAEGMSKKQVESILGPPTDIDNTDFVIMKKTTYVYRQDNGTVTIVFKDDKVSDKYSTLPH
jgi:outer membrane protein assembly factor BamE (lipoprotein component of BamABCDE complex)